MRQADIERRLSNLARAPPVWGANASRSTAVACRLALVPAGARPSHCHPGPGDAGREPERYRVASNAARRSSSRSEREPYLVTTTGVPNPTRP
jgi:hypothetical protein